MGVGGVKKLVIFMDVINGWPQTLLLKQYLGKCFFNERTPTEMFFITVLKICQMYSFSIYPWNFKNICENLSIYPWIKAIFSKLLRCGCFPGNLPQYLRAAIPRKAILQGGYFESSFTQLFRFIIALIFSCVQIQRNRGIIGVFFFTMECRSYSKLIINPILPIGNYAAHLCFLKIVRF